MSSDNKELLLTGLDKTKAWFEQAIPEPTIEQACIQVGCHLEETVEMLDAVNCLGTDAYDHLESESNNFKAAFDYWIHRVEDCDRVALLDSLADQIVTAVGVAHMMGFDILGALDEVNRSNFSKFEDGKPVFDENGKITKGCNYTPPNLKPYI